MERVHTKCNYESVRFANPLVVESFMLCSLICGKLAENAIYLFILFTRKFASSLHPRAASSLPIMTDINVLTVTASELEAKLNGNFITSRQLVKLYLNQIAKYNGYLKAVIAVAPEDLLDKTAAKLDAERAAGNVRGPLHGIPILLKVLNSCSNIYLDRYHSNMCYPFRTTSPPSQSWGCPLPAAVLRL